MKTENLFICELCFKKETYSVHPERIDIEKRLFEPKKITICRKESHFYVDVFNGSKYKTYHPYNDSDICVDSMQPLMIRKKHISKRKLLKLVNFLSKELSKK